MFIFPTTAPDARRQAALDRLRRTMLALQTIGDMLAPAHAGEALEDAIACADRAWEAINGSDDERRMRLVDAIGLAAESPLDLADASRIGESFGIQLETAQGAIAAWRRASGTRARSDTKTPREAKAKAVREALRSAGFANLPDGETLLKLHERWRKSRGRPMRLYRRRDRS